VGCGDNTRHAVKGVGCMRFQLDLGGFLELAKVFLVPYLEVNLISLSSLEVEGCGVVFFHRKFFLYPEGDNPKTIVYLGVQYERLYRMLGQPVVGSTRFF
jgi:hypothetical protein